jgi:uncharacterized protein with PIN domain
MSRIQKAYETRFRWLLQQARARRLDQGIGWLVTKAKRLSTEQSIPLAGGLTRVYEELAAKPFFGRVNCQPNPSRDIRFFCDAGLGGLARWLRAAGYEAEWEPHIDDADLLQRARELSAAVVTTDSMLMERRVVRDRLIPALWLPPTLSIAEQLACVFREFGLTLRPPRCMSCGGELAAADKEALREQIPPRTYRWLNEYFVCRRCGKLFWHGTHWRRILEKLEAL